MDEMAFKHALDRAIDDAYVVSGMPDRRDAYAWATGFLGDPTSGIWFVAENPSLTMIERVARLVAAPTVENQWNVSRGDCLFRSMLVKHGFKAGDRKSPGGWNCYITDLVKAPAYANEWSEKSQAERQRIVNAWFPVLAEELAYGKPKLIVLMGSRVRAYWEELAAARPLGEARVECIYHYSYIALRPDRRRHLSAMHTTRVEEYDSEFARIAAMG